MSLLLTQKSGEPELLIDPLTDPFLRSARMAGSCSPIGKLSARHTIESNLL